MAQQRGAQVLVRALEAHGVEYIFGLPGHGNMNILDAIYDSNQISFKLVRHEQAAAHIADGYARISGEVGVCCSSVGPGAADMIMGIASVFHLKSDSGHKWGDYHKTGWSRSTSGDLTCRNPYRSGIYAGVTAFHQESLGYSTTGTNG